MTLTPDEMAAVDSLQKKLSRHAPKNLELENYFEGKNRLKDMKISIPPALIHVESVVGWPHTTISVLEQRLDFEGFVGADTLGLNDIYRDNDLDVESSLGHVDSLIYGTAFLVVGQGMEGEPSPLITIESPKRMTGNYDMRLRRLTSALAINRDERGTPESGALYLPNETIWLEWQNGLPVDVERDVHNLGRVPVVFMANNPRSGDPYGRSEITRAIRSYTNSAMRTLLGAEIAREFYSAPQRYVMGADEEMFTDSDGNALDKWQVIQGRLLALPMNEEGGTPTVGQFPANSTAPYFEQIRALAQLVAAEAAIPPSYLGFQTDNPASADAIRQMESRLVKKAERRQKQFGRAWMEMARLALLFRDGAIPDEISEVRPLWRDPSTPTRAAAADEAVKLISAGVLLPDSEVTYNRIGLSETDKRVIRAEKQTVGTVELLQALSAAQTPTATPGTTEEFTPAEPEQAEPTGEPRGETVDTFQDLSTGDIVEFPAGYGQVEHIMTGGVLGIEGSEFAIEATPEDPALQVRVWEQVNGEWAATENVIALRYSEVTRIDELP